MLSVSWNPTIFNIIRWVTGSLGQMTHRSSVWCSKHYFFFFHNFYRVLKTLYFYFCKNDFCKKLWKKKYLEHQMLGWWVVRPSDPVTQRIILKIVGFLVDETIVPATQRPSVLYWRLSDLSLAALFKYIVPQITFHISFFVTLWLFLNYTTAFARI